MMEFKLNRLAPLNFDSGLRFELLKQDSFNQFEILFKDEVGVKNLKKIQSFLNEDSSVKCYVVFYNSQIAGYYHIAYSDAIESRTKYKVPLGKDEVYFFKDYTLKKYRGKNIHTFSIHRRLQLCKEAGYNKAFVCVYKNNPFSIRSYSKMGFKIVKTILSIRVMCFQKNIIHTIIQ